VNEIFDNFFSNFKGRKRTSDPQSPHKGRAKEKANQLFSDGKQMLQPSRH
jgi:hypothetical protein